MTRVQRSRLTPTVDIHVDSQGGEQRRSAPNAELYYLGTTTRSATDNTGIVDHIAFLATDPKAFADRFDGIGLASRKRYFRHLELFQMFVKDPDGLTIELNFHGVDDEPSWAADGENYADMPRAS